MIGIYKDTTLQIYSAVGAELRRRREARGLRRSEVAAAMGYKNLSKGSRRVAQWETGNFVPLLDTATYYEAIGISSEHVEAPLKRAGALNTQIKLLGWRCLLDEEALLRSNALLLRDATEEIQRRPELGGTRTTAASFQILWMGGGSVDLHGLTGAWAEGTFVARLKKLGPVYLINGSGSGLSGAGRCVGVDESGAVRHLNCSPSRFFDREQPHPWRGGRKSSLLSLADVIVAVGGEAPPTHFHLISPDGEVSEAPFATYDPATGCLVEHQTGASLSVEGRDGGSLRRQDIYNGVTIGGRTKPLSLGPDWQLGGYGATRYTHSCGLSLYEGVVEGQDGWLPVQIFGPSPPPRVLPLLAELLAPLRGPREAEDA